MTEPKETSIPEWVRSTYCAKDACVEVRRTPDGVVVRSSHDPDVELAFDNDEWSAFLAGVGAGEFEPSLSEPTFLHYRTETTR